MNSLLFLRASSRRLTNVASITHLLLPSSTPSPIHQLFSLKHHTFNLNNNISFLSSFHGSPSLSSSRSDVSKQAAIATDPTSLDDKASHSDGLEISKLGISQDIVVALAKKGITKLFPIQRKSYGSLPSSCKVTSMPSVYRESKPGFFLGSQILTNRGITTLNDSQKSDPENVSEVTPRIKFKRLDKTARHIMQILDKEAVEEVRTQREIPDIRPGYIIQLRLEVPENKRRVSTVKGIVIARRNAGLNTTIRLRRMVAGVGIESLLPLYSPNIKEIKVLDKKKVRRAKLYYLRDKMNALRK